MTLEPKERNTLERERREVENKLQHMDWEIQRIGETNQMALWLAARRNLVAARLNVIKVKLGIW